MDKEKENYKLRTTLEEIVPGERMKFSEFGSQYGGPASKSFVMQTDLTSSQLKNNAKRFLNNQRQQE